MERDSLGNMIVRFCPDKPCTGPGHVHSLILPWHQGFRATPTGVESVEETVIAREKLECMLADAYEAGQAKLPERIEKKLFTFTIDFGGRVTATSQRRPAHYRARARGRDPTTKRRNRRGNSC